MKKLPIPILLGSIVIIIMLYATWQNNYDFRRSMRELKSIRQSLRDSVAVIRIRTEQRDQKLREVIRRELELIDTLNATLAKLNRSSTEIDRKIDSNKKIIDELWREE